MIGGGLLRPRHARYSHRPVRRATVTPTIVERRRLDARAAGSRQRVRYTVKSNRARAGHEVVGGEEWASTDGFHDGGDSPSPAAGLSDVRRREPGTVQAQLPHHARDNPNQDARRGKRLGWRGNGRSYIPIVRWVLQPLAVAELRAKPHVREPALIQPFELRQFCDEVAASGVEIVSDEV